MAQHVVWERTVWPTTWSCTAPEFASDDGHGMKISTFNPTANLPVGLNRTPVFEIFTAIPSPVWITRFPATTLYSRTTSTGYRRLDRLSTSSLLLSATATEMMSKPFPA